MQVQVKLIRRYTGWLNGVLFNDGVAVVEVKSLKDGLLNSFRETGHTVTEIPKYSSGSKTEYLILLTNRYLTREIRGVKFKDGIGVTKDSHTADLFAKEFHSVFNLKPKPKRKSKPKTEAKDTTSKEKEVS